MALGMIGNDYRNMPHSYDYGMPQNHSLAEEDSRKLHYNADGELVRDDQASYNGEKKVDGTKDSRDDSEDGRNKIGKSREECQTCKNRKYVDGSNDANVSFKNAAHVSPEAAASAVRAHEGQHVSNAYNRAQEEDGKVIRASVRIHTSICPECGRSYVSGGVTDTQIKYYNENNPYQQDLKQTDGLKLRGSNVDYVS